MEIVLKQLLEGHNRLAFQKNQESLGLKPEDMFLMNPAEIDFDILRTGDKYNFDGKINATIEPECARCLKLFTYPVNARVNFILDQSEAVTSGQMDDDDYRFISKSTLTYDVLSQVREALLVSLPMKLLCSPDCLGLCPQCGINRNIEKCDCKIEKADPRWGKLSELLKG